MAEVIFDETWMRQRADDCRGTANAIKGLLDPADKMVGRIKTAASGWGFLESLDEMMKRWEDLNKLLREELEGSAKKIDECAGNHGRSEDTLHKIMMPSTLLISGESKSDGDHSTASFSRPQRFACRC